MPIRPELLDELLKDCQNPQEWLGEGGILKQLTKAIVERALDAEMDTHLQATKQSATGKPDRLGSQPENAQRRVWSSEH